MARATLSPAGPRCLPQIHPKGSFCSRPSGCKPLLPPALGNNPLNSCSVHSFFFFKTQNHPIYLLLPLTATLSEDADRERGATRVHFSGATEARDRANDLLRIKLRPGLLTHSSELFPLGLSDQTDGDNPLLPDETYMGPQSPLRPLLDGPRKPSLPEQTGRPKAER